MKKTFLLFAYIIFLPLLFSSPAKGATYYIAPDVNPDGTTNTVGNDANSGTSPASPWKSFTKAWTVLVPGDTLLLLDGTYKQVLQPTTNGTSDKYITVAAFTDGKAIIDGENIRQTVVIGTIWDNIPGYTRDSINPYGNYLDIEGIIAKNSIQDVWEIYSRNVILRRNSGYNANPHNNYHVFTIWSLGTPANPANVLLEDNIAAGSGRKMILAYDTYVNVVIRRNFSAWQWWLGDNFCQSYWPQADGIEIYPKAYADQPDVTNNSIVENNILFGLTPNTGFDQNPNPGNSIGNNFLGDIALGAGMRWDNALQKFVPPAFDANTCTYNGIQKPAACATSSSCIKFSNVDYRSGFVAAGNCSQKDYITKNNVYQDLFAWNNGGLGLSTTSCGWGSNASNNKIIRATLINNGTGNPPGPAGAGNDAVAAELATFSQISDSKIGKVNGGAAYTGGGAQLQNRYVDGTLTSEPLWPWPMEARIKAEFADPTLFQANGVQGQIWNNFSVTQIVCQNILLPNGAVTACPTSAINSPIPNPLHN